MVYKNNESKKVCCDHCKKMYYFSELKKIDNFTRVCKTCYYLL